MPDDEQLGDDRQQQDVAADREQTSGAKRDQKGQSSRYRERPARPGPSDARWRAVGGLRLGDLLWPAFELGEDLACDALSVWRRFQRRAVGGDVKPA